MAVISCDLRLVTDKAASVTELLVRAPRVRATGVKTVVTAPDRVPVTNGVASFTVLPGACVVTLVALGTPIATIDLLVPDVASTTLVECILAGELAGNAEVSELRTLSEQVVSQIAGKVDRITSASVVLATNASGAQSSVPYSQSATANSVAQRDSGGRLTVATPISAGHASPKAYVDGVVNGVRQNTITVGTEGQATALTGLRVGDYVQVLATGNIYKVV